MEKLTFKNHLIDTLCEIRFQEDLLEALKGFGEFVARVRGSGLRVQVSGFRVHATGAA